MRKTFKEFFKKIEFFGGSSVGTLASIHSVFGFTFLSNPLVDGIFKLFITLIVAFLTGLVTTLAGVLVKKAFKSKGEKESEDDSDD